jgi:hypothetical protein
MEPCNGASCSFTGIRHQGNVSAWKMDPCAASGGLRQHSQFEEQLLRLWYSELVVVVACRQDTEVNVSKNDPLIQWLSERGCRTIL